MLPGSQVFTQRPTPNCKASCAHRSDGDRGQLLLSQTPSSSLCVPDQGTWTVFPGRHSTQSFQHRRAELAAGTWILSTSGAPGRNKAGLVFILLPPAGVFASHCGVSCALSSRLRTREGRPRINF